tara:strand:- start:8233 stop:8865 length:633 start_codon:yes stop_codon:yes gene_type:complete
MSPKNDGVIIILSSPSGAGKTTLVKKISEIKKYIISISHTTRTPRINEINGKDYYFVDKEEFDNLKRNDEFLEYAEVFKNYYGSSKKTVIKNLKEGKSVIFDIDWQGAEQIKTKKLDYKIISFFILPPSKEVLLQRLLNRDVKDKLIVEERMKQFSKDILQWKNYDFVVINDDLEKCYKEIIYLIDSKIKNLENKYNTKNIEKHIENLIN